MNTGTIINNVIKPLLSLFPYKLITDEWENQETSSASNSDYIVDPVILFQNDIVSTIQDDYFESGINSKSEYYIKNILEKENCEILKSAIMQIYHDYYFDEHILTGLLTMMGCINYEDAKPQGPIMALGLLQHKNIDVRDKAIQLFEEWNSKESIKTLKQLKCDKKWMQDYVNKVIKNLQKYGE